VGHRILSTLESAGYLETEGESRRYRLGFRSVQLGLIGLSQLDVRRQARSRLQHLRNVTKETVNLSLRVGDKRVYIDSLESPQEIRQRVELGREMDLFLGASSKAILAFLPRGDRERILELAEGQHTVQHTAISVPELWADLAAIQIRGYATSISERLAGAFSVAVPIFDHDEDVIGSVSVSGPVHRWRDDLAERFGELLIAEVGLLSRDLGSLRQHPWQEVRDIAIAGSA
jgi:DNA-binding IclR family transcriptional regulator